MSYRRSISTLGCPDLSLAETIALAQRHHLDAVELRALAHTIDLPTVFTTAYGTPTALAAWMKSAAVPIISLDTSLKLADNSAADREDFLRFLPWAEAIGVPWLRVFDGGHAADPATHQAMADTVAWWRALKKQNGWQAEIMVETHDALCTTAAIQQFLTLAPRTAILWDTQHTWRNGGENPATTWRAIGSQVVHVHVKDSVSRPSAKHPFSYVLPGEGEFPMATLRPLLQAEFTGCVSLEWERLWHPTIAPLDDALNASAKCQWL
ncbi:MAG: TIM barrel protein [Opitutaceae bacterium]